MNAPIEISNLRASLTDEHDAETQRRSELAQEPSEPIHATQNPWFVGTMMVGTAGFYSMRYLYRHAKDLRQLHSPDTKPWLWMLAPLLPITLPFVLSRMSSRYAELGGQIGLQMSDRGTMYGIVIMLAYIALRAYEKLSTTYLGFVLAFGFLVMGAVWAWLTHDVNRYKKAVAEEHESIAKKRIKATLGLIVASPIIAILSIAFALEMQNLSRTTVELGKAWKHEDLGIEITFEDPWRTAQIGTNSDGSAQAEFTMSSLEWLLIFDHTGDSGVREIARFRRQEFLDAYSNGRCAEKRYLQNRYSTVRVSELYCEATSLGEPEILLSTVYDDANKTIEILGEASPVENEKSESLRRLRRTASGFAFTPPTRATDPQSTNET